MEIIMKKAALIFILLLTLSLLPSCSSGERVPCLEILTAMVEAEVGLPAGKAYSSEAAIGDDGYLSEHLVNALYGDGARPVMADGWLDLAIFLPSSAHPCEFAVFLCDSSDTAKDTARMLCRRLDVIRAAKNGEHSRMIGNAKITVAGNYVLFIISSDSENALRMAKRAMR